MVDIDAVQPGEAQAIEGKLRKCHEVYARKGKGGLIEMVLKLFIEVRRLSFAVEAKNNELKRLRNEEV